MAHFDGRRVQENPESRQPARPQDIKQLWEQWDQGTWESSPRQYFRGINALGLGLLVPGLLLQVGGPPGYLHLLSSVMIVAGALCLAAKKLKTLWQRRSQVG